MSLERIIEKIILDAKQEADRIIKDAQRRKEEELLAYKEAVVKESGEIVEKAKREAEIISKKKSSQMEIEKKRAESYLLDNLMKEVLSAAEEEILNADSRKIKNALKSLILKSGLKGSERVRFSKRLSRLATKDYVESVNKEAKKLGLDASLELDREPAETADIELISDNYRIKLHVKDLFEPFLKELSDLILKSTGE